MESNRVKNSVRQDSKILAMTTEPVEKLVCKLAVPTIISMMITAFYNMADTYFVSRIGTSAAGAVGVVFSFMAIVQACGFLFGNGSGNFISRKLGEQKIKEAEEMATTAFLSALLTGALIGVIGLLFLNQLGKVLGATHTILPYAKEYLKYILVGVPFMMASLVLNNQLRFQGNAAYGMLGICTGAVLNILLDPILIFYCQMGIAGAALATSISQFVGLCVLFILCNKKGIIKIKIKYFKPSIYNFKEILRGGLPSLFRQSVAGVATIFLNLFAGVYGDAAIAAMSIVSRIGMFASSALIGFGQGFQPVCGFNYGAREFGRVRKAFYFCVKVASVVLIVLAVLGFVYAEALIGIFKTGDVRVMEIGKSALRWQCISFPLMGYVVLSNMMLQTIGKVTRASIVALARQGIFYIPILFILAPTLQLQGIKMAQPIADILAFAIAIPLSSGVLKEMKCKVKETKGLVHLYHGDGKGKTTAAVGLALRAAGSGIPVLFVQFLKDGTSSELTGLRKMRGITVLCVTKNFGFYGAMDTRQKEEAKRCYTSLWKRAVQICADGKKRVLILDESMAAYHYELLPREKLLTFLKEKPENLEVVMTGRDPDARLCELADYITEMKKQKHPYEQGIKARKGIEF